MRQFNGLPELHSAEALLAFLRADVNDRVIFHASDLDPSDFDGDYATRTDDSVIVIYSLRAVGATSIESLCNVIANQQFQSAPHKGEVAVIGSADRRNDYGRITPDCIKILLDRAENQALDRELAWCGYEDVCVLADHPEAEAEKNES